MRKPGWLKRPFPAQTKAVKKLLRKGGLNTVCEEASCPNIGECFKNKTATFLILGKKCTRNCRYCNVTYGVPDKTNREEPNKILDAVKELGLKYAVITSVTRDDLPDGGASHFADVIMLLRKNGIGVEVLIPDFIEHIKTILDCKPDVFSHNIETVHELFKKVRPKGNYQNSLNMLKLAKKMNPKQKTKSGLMFGLGESKEMIISSLKDLRKSDVNYLTIGQYLQPTKKHWPVKRYYTPEEFEDFKVIALKMGFVNVFSGPFVRSSYMAEELIMKK